jgi:hypothetical protein
VSWAERWAKAKENHARVSRIRARTRNFVFAAIFAGAGGHALYSDVTHQIHGRPATATLIAHLKLCTVEYQRVGEQERKDQLPCELAEEFQRRVGSNKVKLSRDNIALIKFPLADGRAHEASVDDVKLGTYTLDVGATLPVFYAPDNPADVRAKMSWETIKIPLILLAIGLPFVWLTFGGSFAGLFGWAFRGRTSRAEEEPVHSGYRTPTFSRMSELGDTGKSQRRQDTATPRPVFGMRNR